MRRAMPPAPAPRAKEQLRLPALWALVALALALQLPCLRQGFLLDDYGHALVFGELEVPAPMRWWSLFDFGARQDWAEFSARYGGFPWWTSQDWAVRFFRPLASLSLALDHWLWGGWAAGHHLISLGGYAALLLAVHRLFLALGLTDRAAARGLLFLGLSHTTVLPVQWIANRNSLLEALFTVCALLVLLVPGPRRRTGALALVLAAAAAASKESGLVAFALAAAWWFAQGRKRAAAVALGLGFSWLLALAAAGFGTRSAFYATPWRDTATYAQRVGLLATGGSLALLTPFSLDLVATQRALWPAVAAAGALVGAPLGWLVERALRGARSAWLLWLWLALALLAQGAALPSDRLLFVPAIAAAGLLASYFETPLGPRWSAAERWLRRGLFASLTAVQGALLLFQGVFLGDMAQHLRSTISATDLGPLAGAAGSGGRRTAIVLQADSAMQAFGLGTTWLGTGGDPDVRFVLLQAGPRGLRWTRTGDVSFEVESLDEPFLAKEFERLYLSHEPGFDALARWSAPPLAVTALAVDERGRPTRLKVELESPLEDDALVFLRPVDGVLTHIDPPAVGESLELKRAASRLRFMP
jgi:hypothetical protein